MITPLNSDLEPGPIGTFAGISVMLFGGVYVLFSLMQEVVVGPIGQLNEKQFIDAIAVVPLNQWPILVSEAFTGFNVLGVASAVMAALGIFAPLAIFLVTCSYYLEKMESSDHIMAALMCIRSAVAGMIAALILVQATEKNYKSLAIFSASLILLIYFKLEVEWVIPEAGPVGYLLW